MQNWIEQLEPIILEFRDGSEPLDGDEVGRLVDIIRAKINLHEGNITEEEYQCIMERVPIQEILDKFIELYGFSGEQMSVVVNLPIDSYGLSPKAKSFGYTWLPKHGVWVNTSMMYDEENETILNYLLKENDHV